MDHIRVTVNGRQRPLRGVSAHTTALDWLRDIGLTGAKEGCAEGECGACAVLLATPDLDGGTEWTAVNACLVPAAALDGQELVTAEGLGTPEHPHPVQARLAEAGGSQCGYCTPGFACSMAGEFYRRDRRAGEPDAADAADSVDGRADAHHGPNGFDLHALSGNLCRCTGYRPIRDAAFALGSPEADDPLAEVQHRLAGRVPLLAELFPQFASPLIRNRATIGGNLGTASPIGDTAPALLALEARVVLVSADGEREVDLSDYFTGYRETVRRSDELIRAVRIPLPLAGLSAFHKVAKRRFDDISSVAVGFALDLDDGVIAGARIGLGGIAATPIRARATEAVLVGRPWTLETARDAASVLGTEGTPMSDHRASAEYRSLMLGTALLKLHRSTPLAEEGVPA